MEKSLFSVTLFNTGYYGSVSFNACGCASSGIATTDAWLNPSTNTCANSDIELDGYTAVSTLSEALHDLEWLRGDAVQAGIVFFGNCGGENAFMHSLCKMFPNVPFVGGAAAIGSDGYKSRLLPHPTEVCVLLITDTRYTYKAEFANVHDTILCDLTACGHEVRSIDSVSTGDEIVPLRELIQHYAGRFRVAGNICEHFTVSDIYNRNIHLIPNGNSFDCGCDLPDNRRLMLRYTSSEHACSEMDKFYAQENSLIFGCAGLKALCSDHNFTTGRGSLGAFLFGETVFLGDHSNFANLMLSRLTVTRK